jgi:hypothetical protein
MKAFGMRFLIAVYGKGFSSNGISPCMYPHRPFWLQHLHSAAGNNINLLKSLSVEVKHSVFSNDLFRK